MANNFLAINTDARCQPLQPGSSTYGGGSGANVVRITASVGVRGVNRNSDVRVIQKALNDVPADQGRPTPLLVVDGMCGPKTNNAIQQFQVKHFGWGGADGRVDPDKRTIAKLNELTGGSQAQAAEESGRVLNVVAVLSEVFRCIRAAQANLLVALTAVDSSDAPSILPVFSRAEKMRLANRHFDIDRHPTSQRRQSLQKVLNIYDTMMQVFQRPGGVWGPYIFSPDKLNTLHSAYVLNGGGYAAPGQTETKNGVTLRKDSIYLGRKINDSSSEMRVYIIIHELAHFVGNSPQIIDHSYGWHDEAAMQRLTPAQKLNNANNYNNLAFDATYGRKPAGYYAGGG